MSTVVIDSLINNNENIVKPIISLKWRVIVPAASSIDWTELRRTVGIHKGRTEYRPIEDLNDIKEGIALNEKIAGLGFPDSI